MVLFSISCLGFSASISAQSALININTAGSEELQTLKGIGPTYAQRIIDYRVANGPFAKIDDIKNVSGIGEVTFSNIKDFITVGETAHAPDGAGASATTTAIVSGQTGQSVSDTTSSHYSATPITNVSLPDKVSVGAGRDRIGVVGSPLEFRAETDLGYTRNSIFKWNFGDGSEGAGDVLNHVYEYPGEYIVVLNLSMSGGEAVARANVKIIEPELSITLATPERIEIKNNSKYEVNLFGRVLVAGNTYFAFPRDTIIKAGQNISFSSRVTKLFPESVLVTSILIVGNVENAKLSAEIKEQKAERIVYLTNQIATLQQQMASISQPSSNLAVKPPSGEQVGVQQNIETSGVIEEGQEDQSPQNDNGRESQPQTASAVRATSSNGWFETLKRFFLRTR